jgi:uncharacterized membrane protein YccC
MVFLIENPYVKGALTVVTLILSLAMVQKNYRASATFITLSVVFIYAILEPDVLTVIQFRVLDTLLGAGLSYAAILWLWPTWEFVDIRKRIVRSIETNIIFLRKISAFYQNKGKLPTSYGIARKEAFLAMSNLSSVFQRLTQNPKSKQKNIDGLYELVVLSHSFLSSLASLSTYIQSHETGKAPEQFAVATELIVAKLESTLRCLEKGDCDSLQPDEKEEDLFGERLLTFDLLQPTDSASVDERAVRGLQEAYLIQEQQEWLFSISENMLKLASSLVK